MVADMPALTWTSPAGVDYPLDPVNGLASCGWMATEGVKGLGAAPITLTADPSPIGGTAVRHVQPGPRMITLPLYVEGADNAEFLGRWRNLAGAFTSTTRQGAGVLTVAYLDETARMIDAYYQDGWDAAEFGSTADTAVLTLYCPDPYFRDDALTWITRSSLPLGASFLSPFPTVSSATTLGTSTVNNPGGVVAWPTWQLTGPASDLTATNVTTGESFTLDIVTYNGSALDSGDVVTVSTSPPAVTGPDGSNWTGALDWPSAVLWGLDPGDSVVTFTAGGGGADTSVEAYFYARYETA
jgi:hypothetical protein